MSLADQIVQVGHACLEAGNRFKQPDEPSHLVLLRVPSEQKLYDAGAQIELAGIRYQTFYEPDNSLGHTALCTEPISGIYRRMFRRFPLWRVPDVNN